MSAHSPGPWTISWYDEYSEETGDPLPPTHAGSIRDASDESVCGTCDGCNKIAKANAHLIAAAPDLLAALEELVSRRQRVARERGLPDLADSDGRYARAVAAIAKARGT